MKVADAVTLICCGCLALIVIMICAVVIIGLFDSIVDNVDIFKMITPAFNTIIGAFVGTIAGIKIGQGDDK